MQSVDLPAGNFDQFKKVLFVAQIVSYLGEQGVHLTRRWNAHLVSHDRIQRYIVMLYLLR